MLGEVGASRTRPRHTWEIGKEEERAAVAEKAEGEVGGGAWLGWRG